ncbi:MAG: RNase H-like domain-containing protein [Gammaproteobacteria bacterium]
MATWSNQNISDQQSSKSFNFSNSMVSILKNMDLNVNFVNTITTFDEKKENFKDWFLNNQDILEFEIDDDIKRKKVLYHKLSPEVRTCVRHRLADRNISSIDYKELVKTLEDMYVLENSIVSKRIDYFNIRQLPDESFIKFYDRVNYSYSVANIELMKKDDSKLLMFFNGCDYQRAPNVLKKLEACFEKDNFKFEDVLNIVKREHVQANNLKNLEKKHVHRINTLEAKQNQKKDVKELSWKRENRFSARSSSKCSVCGFNHDSQSCKFKDYTCHNCNVAGHLKSMCNKYSNNYLVHSLKSSKQLMIIVNINGVDIRFSFDSGAEISTITEETWRLIGKPKVRPERLNVSAYNNSKIEIRGSIQAEVSYMGNIRCGYFFIVPNNYNNTFGCNLIQEFKLKEKMNFQLHSFKVDIKVEEVVSYLKNLNESSPGVCKHFKANIKLIPNAHPVFRNARNVPFAALPKVVAELNRLESQGFYEKTDYSRWAAPVLAVKKKDGGIRLCGDYSTGLNEAIETYRYNLPTIEDIFSQIHGAKIFSKIDLKEAFLQIELENDAREWLAINTPNGIFKCNRLTYGIKVAPAIFQNLMDIVLKGVDGALAYIDDVIVFAKNSHQMKEALVKIFDRLQKFGLKANLDKSEFFVETIKFLGFVIDKNGRKSDPDKVKDFLQMKSPQNVKEVQVVNGLINYYAPFIKDLSKVRGPINKLLSAKTDFYWSSECEEAYKKIKVEIAKMTELRHFDPLKVSILSADASPDGIGGVLSQVEDDGKVYPVYHFARSLNKTQQNYPQTEKEGLALIYAVQKFHKYLYGRKFTLLTDHQPLLTIFKPANGIKITSSKRLQRWALTLLNYDFNIEYVNTINFGAADALSRLCKFNSDEEDTVIAALCFEEIDLEEKIKFEGVNSELIALATTNDPILSLIRKFMDENRSFNEEKKLKEFENKRKDLSVCGGCVLFGDRIMIPEILKSHIMKELHKGHPGIERTKSVARETVYWKGIETDIISYVNQCENCNLVAKRNPRLKPIDWPKPKRVWDRLHMDFAGPINNEYLFIIVDAFSKWPEVVRMKSANTENVLKVLDSLFTTFGLPSIIVSDNGPQFSSGQMATWCKKNGIKHLFSPPYHPQSNGQAERFVDTVKRSLAKNSSLPKEEAIALFLSNYRNCKSAVLNGKSPAELMFNRKLLTRLDRWRPKEEKSKEIVDSIWLDQSVWFQDYYVQSKPVWKPGVVIAAEGVILTIQDQKKKLWIRHLNHVRKRIKSNMEYTRDRDPEYVPFEYFADDVDDGFLEILEKSKNGPNDSEEREVNLEENEVILEKFKERNSSQLRELSNALEEASSENMEVEREESLFPEQRRNRISSSSDESNSIVPINIETIGSKRQPLDWSDESNQQTSQHKRNDEGEEYVWDFSPIIPEVNSMVVSVREAFKKMRDVVRILGL